MQDLDPIILIIMAVVAALVGLVLLIFIYRVVRWLFRLVATAIRAPLAGTPAWMIGIAAIITAILVPGVFLWLVDIVRDVGLLIVYDLPTAFVTAIGFAYINCFSGIETESDCLLSATQPLLGFWTSNVSSVLRRFWPAPEFLEDIIKAIAIFAGLILVGVAATRLAPKARVWLAGRQSSPIGRSVPLAFALLAALYLIITAIVATPVFEQDSIDLQIAQKNLVERISTTTIVIPNVESKPSSVAENERVVRLIKERGEKLKPILSEASASFALTYILEGLEREVELHSEQAKQLSNIPSEFPQAQKQYYDLLIGQFVNANRGRLGKRQTEAHADALADHYRVLMSESAANVRRCGDTIARESRLLGVRLSIAQAHMLSIETEHKNGGYPDDVVFAFHKVYLAQSGESRSSSGTGRTQQAANVPRPTTALGASTSLTQSCDIGLVANPQIPTRRNLEDSLGIFGLAAGWLLQTETRNLALITGMLGFGLFGALGASFIRGSNVDKNGQPRMPSNAELMGVFIRGISAAILIYLVVVGGLAVFTKTEPEPNAYAVFFACFVAAVFSEDVWDWARRRQQSRIARDREDEEPKPGAPKSVAEEPPPPAPPAQPAPTAPTAG